MTAEVVCTTAVINDIFSTNVHHSLYIYHIQKERFKNF